MKYVSFKRLSLPLRFGPKLRLSHRRRRIRGDESAVKVDDDFIEAIDLRLLSPEVIVDNEETHSAIQFVRLGYNLELPEGVALSWVRFRVDMFSRDSSERTVPANVISLIPQQVQSDAVFDGRIAVYDSGEIERESVTASQGGPSAVRFEPFGLGYKIGSSQLVWDFLPLYGRPPTGTDNLIVSMRTDHQDALYSSSSAQIRVVHRALGAMTLEHPAEVQQIRATPEI